MSKSTDDVARDPGAVTGRNALSDDDGKHFRFSGRINPTVESTAADHRAAPGYGVHLPVAGVRRRPRKHKHRGNGQRQSDDDSSEGAELIPQNLQRPCKG